MDTNIICIYFRCHALCVLSGVSPASAPPQKPMLVMLSEKNTRNACLFCDPSNHTARGVPAQDALVRTPLWLTMMKAFPSGNGHRDPKQADGNDSGQLVPCPQVSICPPSDGHSTPWPQKSDYLANEGWQWREDIPAWANCHHVLSPIGLKSQKPHEDASTREPEPEVALMKLMEEPLGKSPNHFFHSSQLFLTPPLPISSLSHYTCLHNHHQQYACWIPPPSTPTPEIPPIASSPHSHNESQQELTDL
ncbi:hypothetical protein O181_032687 [Austropuccinia psidii MF-1]|uniref:Uncharacterized protein n=1 Tax=Austropuccinia psidii MF-1 TaxID=1389203 RepID=A0A9Q3H6G9_9BASI|nr:hypothetical protein [Austropuccinia psidii MF-1]